MNQIARRFSVLIFAVLLLFAQHGNAIKMGPLAPHDWDLGGEGSRQSCIDLLRNRGVPGPSDNVPEDERQMRIDAGAALLMLIFEHPVLLQAAARENLRDADLLTLFHLSGAFAFVPGGSYRNWRGKDLTRYEKIVNELTFDRKTPETLRTLGHYSEATRAHHSSVGEDVVKRRRSHYENFASALVFAMKRQWALHMDTVLKGAATLQKLRSEGTLFPPETSGRNFPVAYVTYKNLTAFTADEIGTLRNIAVALDESPRGLLVGNLVKNFVVEHIDEIFNVRSLMLKRAMNKKIGVRETLVHPSQAQNDLRLKIFQFATQKIEPLALEHKSAIAVIEQTTPEHLNLPVPVVTPTYDSSGFDQLLVEARENPADDPLLLPRQIMGLTDQAMPHVSKSIGLQDLQRVLPPLSEFERRVPELLAHLQYLTDAADRELETTDDILTKFRPLAELAHERLTNFGERLLEGGLAPGKVQLRLNQADRVLMALSQTLTVLESKSAMQLEWNEYLGQLQALLRQYQAQRILGRKADDLARRWLETVKAWSAESDIESATPQLAIGHDEEPPYGGPR